MIRLTETTPQDIPQIREWLDADPWHRGDSRNDPELMTTGNGVLAFCLQDDKGPIVFIKLIEVGETLRVAMQFAPRAVVSKRRLIEALITVGFPIMKGYATGWGCKALAFESKNPSLLRFCSRNGFENVEGTNDFCYYTEEQHE